MSTIFPQRSNKIKFLHRRFRRLQLEQERKKHKLKYGKSTWESIEFSPHINLIKRPDNVLSLFNRAYELYKQNKNVHFDLTKCVEFSPESIAVLAAYISTDAFTNGMASRGDLPKNSFVKRLIKESGFFDYVRMVGGSQPVTKSKMLHKLTNNKVETDEVKEVCLFVKDKVEADYVDDMEPLYDVLVEAMQNTNNHASPKGKGLYDWWLTRFVDRETNIIHYTFLDVGVGVYNSLPVQDFLRKVRTQLNLTSNIDLVDRLVNGEIKSSTGRPERGKGIPQIFDLSKDELFKDFYMLSNDVLVDAKTMKKTKLNQEFYGTLYYFTIEIKKYTYAG